MHHSTNCPVCLRLPEWQRGILTDPDDFCQKHARERYRSFPEPTEDEWAAAEATRRQRLGDMAWMIDVRGYLPRRLWRCTACGKLAVDIVRHEELDCLVTGWDSQPYYQAPSDPWDMDDVALPLFEGMRRRSS